MAQFVSIPVSQRTAVVPGARFTELVAVENVGGGRWRFRCDCGREKVIRASNVSRGATKRCGCGRKALGRYGAEASSITAANPVEYKAWTDMISRSVAACRADRPSVLLHPAWRESFRTFLADVGPRPGPDHTLDRDDKSRGFVPGNVSWVRRDERDVRWFVEKDGARVPLGVICRERGIPLPRVKARLRLGWPLDRALAA